MASLREDNVKQTHATSLQEKLQELTAQVAQRGALLEARKGGPAQLAQLRSRIQEDQSALDRARAEQARLKGNVDGDRKAFAEERVSSEFALTAQAQLTEARESLAKLREELNALMSDAAKQAALSAHGGDLPASVAPRQSQKVVVAMEAEAVWAKHGGKGEVPGSLQAMCTSQAAIATLYAALAARASEIRQGLRQLSFAQAATARTRELTASLEAELATGVASAKSLASERESLAAELKASQAQLAQLNAKNATERSRNELLTDRLRTIKEHSHKSRADAYVAALKAGEARQKAADLGLEDEEVAQRLEVLQKAIDDYPAEVSRRVGAAEALARRMQGEAKRAKDALEQTRSRIATLHQARSTLEGACVTLDSQIDSERTAHDTLRAAHERMSVELEAMAKHYLAALPPLPGADQRLPPPLPPKRDVLPDHAAEGAHGPLGGLEAAARGGAPTLSPARVPNAGPPGGVGGSGGGREHLSL